MYQGRTPETEKKKERRGAGNELGGGKIRALVIVKGKLVRSRCVAQILQMFLKLS